MRFVKKKIIAKWRNEEIWKKGKKSVDNYVIMPHKKNQNVFPFRSGELKIFLIKEKYSVDLYS